MRLVGLLFGHVWSDVCEHFGQRTASAVQQCRRLRDAAVRPKVNISAHSGINQLSGLGFTDGLMVID